MPTQCFVVERDAAGLLVLPDGSRVGTLDAPVGAMWRCECRGRQGWMIRIPGADTWQDGHVWPNLWCSACVAEDGTGWTVTGEAPNLTVTPSIHRIAREPAPGETSSAEARGEWHGWLHNGVLS